jgi:hypothetical protein
MAANTGAKAQKQAQAQKKPANGPAAARPAIDVSAADKNLVKWIRGNAQPIQAAFSLCASRFGENRQYGQMNEYLGLASQFGALTGGSAATVVEQPRKMAAGA